jgi:hypothetical protein
MPFLALLSIIFFKQLYHIFWPQNPTHLSSKILIKPYFGKTLEKYKLGWSINSQNLANHTHSPSLLHLIHQLMIMLGKTLIKLKSKIWPTHAITSISIPIYLILLGSSSKQNLSSPTVSPLSSWRVKLQYYSLDASVWRDGREAEACISCKILHLPSLSHSPPQSTPN